MKHRATRFAHTSRRDERRRLHFESLESRNLLSFSGPLLAGADALESDAAEGESDLEIADKGNTLSRQGLEIELHYGPTLSAHPEAQAAAQRAAEYWESVLFDPIVVHLDIEMTTDVFEDDKSLGSTTSSSVTFYYPDVRERLINDAAADEQIVSRLPLPEDLRFDLPPGISTVSPLPGALKEPAIRLNRANALALGFSQLPGDESLFEAGIIVDGYVRLNSDIDFDFDSSDGINQAESDFEGVTVHEIGHALGFVSAMDSIESAFVAGETPFIAPMVMDLFRLRPGQGDEFSTAPRVLNTGDIAPIQVFHDGQYDVRRVGRVITELETGDIPLSTGKVLGDGQQASHFLDDVVGRTTIGIFDPTLRFGHKGKVTDADLRVLGLIGWDRRDSEEDTLPNLAIDSLITTDTTPEITGTIDDPQADVLVRINDLMGLDTAAITVDGNSATTDAFTIVNGGASTARISRVEIVLPGVGGGSGRTAATPYFATVGAPGISQAQDFTANSTQASDVGLLSPESDYRNDGDVPDGSKVLTLRFSDFDPGETFSWRIDMNNGNVLGDDLVGATIAFVFDSGIRAQGVLGPVSGNSDASRLVVQVEHAERAVNHGDGTWSFRTDHLSPFATKNYQVSAVAINKSNAFVAAQSGLLSIEQPPVVAAFQNPNNRFDVDDSGVVNPLDLLLIIRDINTRGNRALPTSNGTSLPLIDVTGDGIVNPLDLVTLIIELNRIASGESDGEGEPTDPVLIGSFIGPLSSAHATTVEDDTATEGHLIPSESKNDSTASSRIPETTQSIKSAPPHQKEPEETFCNPSSWAIDTDQWFESLGSLDS